MNKQILNVAYVSIKDIIFVTRAEILLYLEDNNRKKQLCSFIHDVKLYFVKMLEQH